MLVALARGWRAHPGFLRHELGPSLLLMDGVFLPAAVVVRRGALQQAASALVAHACLPKLSSSLVTSCAAMSPPVQLPLHNAVILALVKMPIHVALWTLLGAQSAGAASSSSLAYYLVRALAVAATSCVVTAVADAYCIRVFRRQQCALAGRQLGAERMAKQLGPAAGAGTSAASDKKRL